MRWRQAIKAITPPVVLDVVRALRPVSARTQQAPATSDGPRPPMSEEQRRVLVASMDRGDYNFDAATVQQMLAMWRYDNALAPYPSILQSAYASGDATAMNDKRLMDVSYRLPYSLAYEQSQIEKYEAFIHLTERHGIVFSGAVVVDVGCGLGGLLLSVQRYRPDAVLRAIECAPSAIEHVTRHHPGISGTVADVEADAGEFISKAGSDCDIVLMTEVLEHLKRPDLAIRNLLALQPRRGIALTVPNGRMDCAPQHIHFWSPESWALFVRQAAPGWKVTVDVCPSKGSPGGFDNFAALRPS